MVQLAYHIPRTTLTASGVIESRITDGERQPYKTTFNLAQGIEADPEDYFLLDLSNTWWQDVTSSFELTPDGRLTSADQTSTGIGPKMVSGAVSIATSLVGTVLGKGFAPVADTESTQTTRSEGPSPQTYEKAHKDLYECRQSARTQLANLCKKRSSVVHDALAADGETKKAAETLEDLRLMEEDLQAQISTINAHEEAWRNSLLQPEFEPFAFTLRTADLTPLDKLPNAGSVPTTNPMKSLYETTGRIVTIERHDPVLVGFTNLDSDDARSNRGQAVDGIAYRHPYKATVRVHRHTKDAERTGDFEVEREVEILVVDDKSPLRVLQVDKGAFKNGKLGISFHDSGTLAKISNDATSAVGATADILAGLPASVAASLESATKIRGHIDTLQSADSAAALARLKTEKATLEERMLVDGLAATADLQAEKVKLQARIDLLTARSDLSDAAAKWLYGEDGNPPSVA